MELSHAFEQLDCAAAVLDTEYLLCCTPRSIAVNTATDLLHPRDSAALRRSLPWPSLLLLAATGSCCCWRC
jgi:hypothetical protein